MRNSLGENYLLDVSSLKQLNKGPVNKEIFATNKRLCQENAPLNLLLLIKFPFIRYLGTLFSTFL